MDTQENATRGWRRWLPGVAVMAVLLGAIAFVVVTDGTGTDDAQPVEVREQQPPQTLPSVEDPAANSPVVEQQPPQVEFDTSELVPVEDLNSVELVTLDSPLANLEDQVLTRDCANVTSRRLGRLPRCSTWQTYARFDLESADNGLIEVSLRTQDAIPDEDKDWIKERTYDAIRVESTEVCVDDDNYGFGSFFAATEKVGLTEREAEVVDKLFHDTPYQRFDTVSIVWLEPGLMEVYFRLDFGLEWAHSRVDYMVQLFADSCN